MKDDNCVEFLQWALPKLNFRWKGYKKVRKQVCKRIQRRMNELQLNNTEEYKIYLQNNKNEWKILDIFCRITISRFYRNQKIFEKIGIEILSYLFKNQDKVRCWSVGCASGEEPYSVSLIFFNIIHSISPVKEIEIIATDIDSNVLNRAKNGCYEYTTIKELPEHWKTKCFNKVSSTYCIKNKYKEVVQFQQQDIREKKPEGKFNLILCRNLVATYFEKELQKKILKEMSQKLNKHGFLVLGKNENTDTLPEDLLSCYQHERIFRTL
ncbi:MAG: CheR family methyltransferase [Bacteroidales bacterium]